MSITPRFTTAAKHTLKTSRLVARSRGVPQADHLDILLAALAIGTELHPTMPNPWYEPSQRRPPPTSLPET